MKRLKTKKGGVRSFSTKNCRKKTPGGGGEWGAVKPVARMT